MRKSIHSPEYQRFCHLLTKARENAGLTQTELAERLARPQSFVSKYERGERRLDVVEFLHVAKALNLDASSLLQEVQNEKE